MSYDATRYFSRNHEFGGGGDERCLDVTTTAAASVVVVIIVVIVIVMPTNIHPTTNKNRVFMLFS